MVKEFFECKIVFEKTNEQGKVKKTSESYLLDSVNFTDAEKTITEFVQENIGEDFKLETVKREKVTEIFRTENNQGMWFKSKVSFIEIDEIGNEKRSKDIMYVQCEQIEKVIPRLKECLKDSVIDYEITSVSDTKIISIIEKN